MLLHFKNPVEFFTQLFVFVGVYVQSENLRAFQPRVFWLDADPARTAAFVLKQFLAFSRQHEVDK